MYLLYTDETNLEPRDSTFFVYGGLVVPPEGATSFSEAIEGIRRSAKIPPDFLLKFNPGPSHLRHGEFIDVKRQMIQAAVDAKCHLLVSLILHNIATSADDARRNEVNRVLYHFNCYLARPKANGIVLIDRFSDKQIDGHLREKFCRGVIGLPYTREHRLERILGIHYSAIGQSHFPSAIDIIIGSLRFAVNAHTDGNTHHQATSETVMKLLRGLFFCERSDGKISTLSLNFSPKSVKAPAYREKYESLRAFFKRCGIEAEQTI